MSKINRAEFIAEMIKGYKEDSAELTAPTHTTEVETTDNTADNIEDRLTATVERENTSKSETVNASENNE